MSVDMSKRTTDIGPPHFEKFLPPIIKENYGKWKYHENPKPGVLVHVSESGAKLYSVRAATARINSIETLRLFADIADELTFDVAWQQGDVAILDNFVAMHGRRTFRGQRQILASLASAHRANTANSETAGSPIN